jgi:hypothetical protein
MRTVSPSPMGAPTTPDNNSRDQRLTLTTGSTLSTLECRGSMPSDGLTIQSGGPLAAGADTGMAVGGQGP